MRPPAIPETLRVCASCHACAPMAGKPECCDCVLERRFAAYAWADGEQPAPRRDGLCPCGCGLPLAVAELCERRFVGDGDSGTFTPAPPRITEAPATIAGRDLWDRLPRVTALPASAEAEATAKRVTAWVGLLVLIAFASGLLFGRFG